MLCMSTRPGGAFLNTPREAQTMWTELATMDNHEIRVPTDFYREHVKRLAAERMTSQLSGRHDDPARISLYQKWD